MSGKQQKNGEERDQNFRLLGRGAWNHGRPDKAGLSSLFGGKYPAVPAGERIKRTGDRAESDPPAAWRDGGWWNDREGSTDGKPDADRGSGTW